MLACERTSRIVEQAFLSSKIGVVMEKNYTYTLTHTLSRFLKVKYKVLIRCESVTAFLFSAMSIAIANPSGVRWRVKGWFERVIELLRWNRCSSLSSHCD